MLEKFILICKNTFVSSNFGGGGGGEVGAPFFLHCCCCCCGCRGFNDDGKASVDYDTSIDFESMEGFLNTDTTRSPKKIDIYCCACCHCMHVLL